MKKIELSHLSTEILVESLYLVDINTIPELRKMETDDFRATFVVNDREYLLTIDLKTGETKFGIFFNKQISVTIKPNDNSVFRVLSYVFSLLFGINFYNFDKNRKY